MKVKTTLGERLRHLREASGLTQGDVAGSTRLTPEYISMVEKGHRVPSLSALEKIAQALKTSLSFLLQENRPIFPLLLRAEGVGELERETLAKFVDLCEGYAFLESLGEEPSPLAPVYDGPSPLEGKTAAGLRRYAERLAETERRRLGLGDQPIKDIFLLLEGQGARPVRLCMSQTSRLSGAFTFSPETGGFILVNGTESPERQTFTAAHEYCHFLKDRAEGFTLDETGWVSDSSTDQRPPKETVANGFAANFLMPASAIARHLARGGHVGPEEVIYLKRYFGVSYTAMAWRLQSLGWVKADHGNRLREVSPGDLERRLFPSQAAPGPAPEEPPSRLFQLAVHHYREGKITLGRLAELLGTTPPEMRRLLSRSGLMPTSGGGGEEGPD